MSLSNHACRRYLSSWDRRHYQPRPEQESCRALKKDMM